MNLNSFSAELDLKEEEILSKETLSELEKKTLLLAIKKTEDIIDDFMQAASMI